MLTVAIFAQHVVFFSKNRHVANNSALGTIHVEHRGGRRAI